MIPTAPTETVEVAGGATFTVKGFSLTDIMILVQRRGPELAPAFAAAKVAFADQGLRVEAFASVAATLTQEFPFVVGEIIAIGSGGTDDEILKRAMDLPMGAQVDALIKIGSLTFTEAMPPKKVLEIVTASLVKLNDQASPGLTPSED